MAMADAKAMRRYQAGIERALSLFDTTNEWADYIAFLSRLLKSLQSPPENADIPLKSTIARYLAQCLNPSLPSGVHQKALEVYDLIFTVIGPSGLARDLTLYLPGLSHTLSFASLSTRPQFLAIYDNHILTLSATTMRPAIRALVMSLLPGLEEETSEDFESTLSTFNQLRKKFADEHHEEVFWQNLFLASVTSPHRRAGVLIYLVRYLPKLPSQWVLQKTNGEASSAEEVWRVIVTPEPGLLVRCFATGLQDHQPLIQRGFLDLLVSHLPLDATIFRDNAHEGDLDVLVNASTTVVLRRDMGLNRRLWAWFTGSEARSVVQSAETPEMLTSPIMTNGNAQDARYFKLHGFASLIRSISILLNLPSQDPPQRARPFRIALSLMDRWEIGGPIVEKLFVPLLSSLQLYQGSAPSQEAFDEVFRSANVFFDGIESRVVASQLLSMIEKQETELALFVITNFNLEEEDMVNIHIPAIALLVIEKIKSLLKSKNATSSSSALQAAGQLSQMLEELLLLVPAGVLHDVPNVVWTPERLADQIVQSYELKPTQTSSVDQEAVTADDVLGSTLTQGIFECLLDCTYNQKVESELLGHLLASMDLCIALLNGYQILRQIGFLSRLVGIVQSIKDVPEARHYQIITGIAGLITTLRSRDASGVVLNTDDLCILVPPLVVQLWNFLLSSKPQFHVEAVESIWRLHALSRSLHLVESAIISLVVAGMARMDSRDDCVQRFNTLWIHSRSAAKQFLIPTADTHTSNTDEILDLLKFPLLQVIDAIDVYSPVDPCSAWTKSLVSLNILFGVVFQQMPKDMTDSSNMSISLQRISKLITLAKGTESQWKAFSGKSGYRDPVFELCSSLTSNQAIANSLGVDALRIVRLLIGGDGIELGEDILKMLSARLVATYSLNTFQDSLLDTLQIAFTSATSPTQPDYLLPILLDGISSTMIDATLDKWITLLCTIVPLLGPSSLSANLIKITTCLCKRIDMYFHSLQNNYATHQEDNADAVISSPQSNVNPERSISNLLSGMEYVLARAHTQASATKIEQEAKVISPSVDLLSSRSSANDHLTVVLCMQDALKVCSRLWLWRATSKAAVAVVDTKSLHYMTTKMRARSRRILENLVEAEPQECLETLMGLWVEKRLQNSQHNQVLELLQTLDGARPKFMMPATFNAIYNRTNPSALDHSQKSSLSVNVNAFELIAFLNDYTNALEDDLLEEIWADCTTFLKEVLSSPMPHRQILFKLLEFTAVLCKKMENTNFGEESRMRRELADLCARLFAAIFVVKPQGLDGSGGRSLEIQAVFDRKRSSVRSSVQAENPLQILQDSLPDLSLVLSSSDRLVTVYNGIATHITGPLLHSKTFPQNITPEVLALLQTISSAPVATKTWRKDVTDAFNDSKFFQNQVQFVELGWMPLLRQLTLTDKAMMPGLLSLLTPPAAAGMMFGVGATAARTEADKKTQSTLKRSALLMLSLETDYFVPHLQGLIVKLEELLTATPESSPSSNSKADVYLTLRAILLTFSQSQLARLWPVIDHQLRGLCSAVLTKDTTNCSLPAQLQGAKLLDVLLLMKPDEFQLHEWLFVTDTMDAIYPPSDIQPIALADQIVLERTVSHTEVNPRFVGLPKKPWLCTEDSRDSQMTESLLASFFTHLSIRTFEDNYSLQVLDVKACRDDLVRDIFME